MGRTLGANRVLAGSACGKRRRGRPLNSVVRRLRMSAIEFRVLLALFAVLFLAHVGYRAPRPAEVAARENAEFDWIRALPKVKRLVLAALLVALLACLIVGLVGMFFFSRPAAVAFFVAVAIVEVGGRFMPGHTTRSSLEWALWVLTTIASILIIYVTFLGSAKELFV